MAKQAKYESTGVDRIGSLPDDILCQILSLLPTKCAVRTSILSPRWRYLFASSISTLDIHHCLRSVPFENVERVNNFLNFVDRLFSNPNQVSLECFRVNDRWVNYDDRWENDYDRINGWLCAALRLGVKKLDLHLMDWLSDALQLGVKRFDIRLVDSLPDALQHGVKKLDIRSITRIASFSLPTNLFTCQSLVALELKMMICYINDPINNISLPNLKTLHFEKSDFLNGYSVRRLISSCPALEEMTLIDCEFHNINELKIDTLSLKRLVLVFNFNAIVIHAPNLVYLKFVTKKGGGYTLGSMKHLETARIEFCIDDIVEWLLGPRATYLLQGICKVKSLYLNTNQAEKLIRMPRESLLPFHNLIKLEIASLNEDVQGRWVIEFLHCVPNLKTLDLAMLKVAAKGGVEPLSKDVPSCLLFHIEEIVISYSNRDEDFEMISYFLHHATFLEKLVIYTSTMKPEITKKFLDLPRKSKKCRVVIL